MGKKTPFYRRGKIQPLCAQPAHERYYRSTSGTTALAEEAGQNGATKHEPWGGSTAYKRYYRAPQRYYRWRSRTRDQKCSSGTTARPERYYRLQAVLPPIGAVLPLIGGTAVPYCRATTAKPDTKRAGSKIEAVVEPYWSGTTS